jgi:carbon storage regulator
MLVLSRKVNEQIVIGADTVVTITEIRGDKVRVGVDAPRFVPVDRLEVRKRKQFTHTQMTSADELDRLKQSLKDMDTRELQVQQVHDHLKACPSIELTTVLCHLADAMNAIDDARDEVAAMIAQIETARAEEVE